MPIIAVGAAVVAAGVATAGVVTAGLTVVTALEIVAAVGATLSAVGTITKNKDLQEAGLALGVVGGVGALAAGAGLLGDAASSGASLFGSDAATTATTADATDAVSQEITATGGEGVGGAAAANTAANAATAAPAAALAGAPTPDAAATAAQPPVDTVDLLSGNSPPVADNLMSNAATEATAPPTIAPPATAPTPTPNATPPSTLGIAGGGAAPTLPGQAPATPTPPGITVPQVKPPTPPLFDPTQSYESSLTNSATGSPPSSMFSSLLKNPGIAYGVFQAGGALVSGLTNPVTPAQITALNAQAAANNAAASGAVQQQANIAQPLPVASRTATSNKGLINSVTGVPA